MSAVFAFAVWLRSGSGLKAEHTQAMDLFVIITLCCLFFLLGCFGTMAWVIWRRTNKPKPHMRLLMELEDEEAEDHPPHESRRPPRPEPPRDAWEQPADWWKK